MSALTINLKLLRKKAGKTQSELADDLGVSRQAYASYEEGRAEPRIQILQRLSSIFNISVDDMLFKDLSSGKMVLDQTGANTRVLSIAVDPHSEEEQIVVVPQKASAGYTKGFADAEFIEDLPSIALRLPEVNKNKTYRLFQVNGESMLPVNHGAYILAEYVLNWKELRLNDCIILITREDGILYKRLNGIIGKEGVVHLVSDNPAHQPIALALEEVQEVWLARAILDFNIPAPGDYVPELHELTMEIRRLRQSLTKDR